MSLCIDCTSPRMSIARVEDQGLASVLLHTLIVDGFEIMSTAQDQTLVDLMLVNNMVHY